MSPEREPGPVYENPGISEELQKTLFALSIAMFCGGVIGFVLGVIITGLVRAG